MATHVPRTGTLVGIGSVVLFLGLLAWLPDQLRPREVSLSLPTGTSSAVERMDLSGSLKAALLPYPLSRGLATGSWLGPTTGPAVALKGLFGDRKTALVNFWASWCPPCLDELPSLETLHRQLAAQPDAPRLVTITADTTLAPVAQLLKTLPFRFTMPTLHDPDGTFARHLGTTRFPETYWIDRDGRVLHKWVGPQAWLSADVLERLSKPPR